MFEETNQTQDIEMPDSIFDDVQENEPAETPDSQPETPADGQDGAEHDAGKTDNPEAKPAEGKEQTIHIKYNGEEMDIPISEAVVLAQKGMNYDHVAEENGKTMAIIDRFARQSGMTREQYLRYLEDAEQTMQANAELETLRGKYPDADESILRELADREIKLRRQDNEREQQTKAMQEDAARRKPWEDFFKAYPDVKPDSLTHDFYDAVHGGKSPTEVYLKQRVAELEEKLATQDKNRENAAKATGSARGDAAQKTVDPFIAGFNDTSY